MNSPLPFRPAGVPPKLQFDGWWLDHDQRPFPKPSVLAKLAAKEDTA